MFAAPMAESLAGEVIVKGIRPEVFRQLLQFCELSDDGC